MLLQNLLVGAIVAIAAAYTVWALMPGPTRLGLVRRLGAWGREPGRAAWIGRATGVIERAAGQRNGGCSGCSSAPTAKPPGRQPPGS